MIEISDEVIKELTKRIEGEPEAGYAAFCRFALMDEKDRPLAKSVPILTESLGIPEQTLRHYSKHFKWNERVNSITSYLLMLSVKEQHALNRELNLEFLQTNREIRRETMDNLRKLSRFLGKSLDWALIANEEKIVAYVTDADGNEVPVKTEIKMAMKASDIPSIVGAMEKGVRLVNNIPTEIINNVPISNANLDEIDNIEELNQLEEKLKKELEGTATQDIEAVQ